MCDKSMAEALFQPEPLYEYTMHAHDPQQSTIYYYSTGSDVPPYFQRGKQLGFGVFKPGEGPGTAPIFVHSKPMSDSTGTPVYRFTRSATPPPGFSGGDLAFYAYPEQAEGAVAVYEYISFADDPTQSQLFFYTSYEDPPPGFVQRGIAFWAPATLEPSYPGSPFVGKCGIPEGAYCVAMRGKLAVNSQVTIGGSRDLSQCIHSKEPPLGGPAPKVFSIRLVENTHPWIYRYTLYVDAQGSGPLGIYNLVLCFEDETNDFYTLEIVSGSRKTYVKNYNSQKPTITTIKWMMLSEFNNPCPLWKEGP